MEHDPVLHHHHQMWQTQPAVFKKLSANLRFLNFIARVIKVPFAEGPHPLRRRVRALPSGWGPYNYCGNKAFALRTKAPDNWRLTCVFI